MWSNLSKKIDEKLESANNDIEYTLWRMVEGKIDISDTKKRFLGNLLIDVVIGAVPCPKVVDWKSQALSIGTGLLRSNLRVLGDKWKYYTSCTHRLKKLTAYAHLDSKFKILVDKNTPLAGLTAVLYGPMGTGKSIYASYLSKLLDWGSANRMKLTDKDGTLLDSDDLVDTIENSEGEVFLIDEIDLIVESKPEIIPIMHAFLDDIKAKNLKYALIMTTNHIDKIKNTPLCRPGRVDIIHEIGYLTSSDVEELCKQWDIEVSEIADKLCENVTVAAVVAACRDVVMTRFGLLREGDDHALGQN